MRAEFSLNLENPATGNLVTLKTSSVLKTWVEHKPFNCIYV